MKTTNFLLLSLFFILNFQSLNAQDGTRIEPDKACINCDTPDTDAVLEIKSTTKGILIPRMTTTQRTAIGTVSAPANGLLVYDTDTNSFWYYSTSWSEIGLSGSVSPSIADADNDTKIHTEKFGDEDVIRFDTDGDERWRIIGDRLESSNTLKNIAIGYASLASNTTGNQNTAVGYLSLNDNTGNNNTAYGYSSLRYNTSGAFNTALGSVALWKNTTGASNIGIGFSALSNSISGSNNIALGTNSLQQNSSGSNNVGIGREANYYNQTGINNTIIGHQAGRGTSSHNKSGNVFLGYQAGYNETSSNKLYIENSNSSSPLIYGEFNTNLFRVNGTLDVNNAYQFPLADGTAGQVLGTDGSGNVSWESSSSDEILDTDGDTKIQVEASPDEDMINFIIKNTLHWRMVDNRLEAISPLNNIAIGENTLFNNTTGKWNTAIGKEALNSNIVGTGNTGIGNQALKSNTGYSNTAVGDRALTNTTTDNNSALGSEALVSNTTGSSNNAFGSISLRDNTTGSSNNAFGYAALQKNTTGYNNLGFGNNALFQNDNGFNNVAVGNQSLYSNTEGNFNTANGSESLYSNTEGDKNTAIGFNSMFFNTTGNNNTANGYRSLYNNTTGNNNTANGYQALNKNTTGTDNIAIGYQAMLENTTGVENIVIGKNALSANTGTGSNNIAIGTEALMNFDDITVTDFGYNIAIGKSALKDGFTPAENTIIGHLSFGIGDGIRNTTLGYKALANSTGGSYNVAIGHQSGITSDVGDSLTLVGTNSDVSTGFITLADAFGHSAIVNADNKVRIGSATITNIEGQVVFTAVSDGRFKYDVKEEVPGLEFINQLRPVTYLFDTKKFENHVLPDGRTSTSKNTQTLHTGFIAQEVESAANEIGYDFHGVAKPTNPKDNYGLRYAEFVVPLVKAVQEISITEELIDLKVEDLENENVLLKEQLGNVQDQLEDMKIMIAQLQGCCVQKEETPLNAIEIELVNAVKNDAPYLEQNAPNPFYEQTIIKYFLPKNFESAMMRFSDLQGRELKTTSLQTSGHGTISISAKELVAGTYTYTLVVDGKIVATKKMVLTR